MKKFHLYELREVNRKSGVKAEFIIIPDLTGLDINQPVKALYRLKQSDTFRAPGYQVDVSGLLRILDNSPYFHVSTFKVEDTLTVKKANQELMSALPEYFI